MQIIHKISLGKYEAAGELIAVALKPFIEWLKNTGIPKLQEFTEKLKDNEGSAKTLAG